MFNKEFEDLQANYHRFNFSSLIGTSWCSFNGFPEEVCKTLNSVEIFTMMGEDQKQASIIMNASSNTIHTLSLGGVTLYPTLLKNDLEKVQHLTLERMKAEDFLFLLKKCTN